jgi:membrane protein DedA with SNARE-associated domain
VSSLASGIAGLSGWLAYLVVVALVFGETAVFIGFFVPGETAVVLGGVLASRGHLTLWLLIVLVVAAALAGPLVGYEIGRRMGDRLFASRVLRRVPGGVDRTRAVLRDRGGLGVLLGRFVAIVRAIMPAAAGAAPVRYAVFLRYNLIGGVIWGVGYTLLGYLAGSAYTVIEKRVGAGLAVAAAVLVVAALAAWAIRKFRRDRARPGLAPGAAAPATATAGPALAGTAVPDPAATEPAVRELAVPDPAVPDPAAAEPAVPEAAVPEGDRPGQP